MQASTPQIPLPKQVMEQNQKEFLVSNRQANEGLLEGAKWEKEAGGILTK